MISRCVRNRYAFISEGGTASEQSITIPQTIPGTYYIMVVGEHAPTSSNYTLLASQESLVVDSVSLTQFGEDRPFTVAVSGAGFDATTALTLIAGNGTRYTALSTTLNSSTSIRATFAATVPAGVYKLEVKNGSGTAVVVENAARIINENEQGADFNANVILPSGLSDTGLATLYVEYTNTGNVAMRAPLLTLRATVADEEGAKMTLDANRLASGMWTSTVPAGFSTNVQIYADGAQLGVLLPGETIRVPVYWTGWNTLLSEGDHIDFTLEVIDVNNTNPLDFAELKPALKPEGYTEEAWNIVWSRLEPLMGSTWGDYVTMLGDIADSLELSGTKTAHCVDELFAVALQWANDGFNPFGRLVTNTDLAVGGLSFNRIFIGTEISSRYYEGDLGFGWDHNWNWKLGIKANGDCVLKGPFGVERLFQSDSRNLGDFISQHVHGQSTTRLLRKTISLIFFKNS